MKPRHSTTPATKTNVMLSWWELRHGHSSELMFFIKVDGDEMAEHYGRLVADLANWEQMRSVPPWEAPPHSYELIDFLSSTKDVFYAPDYEMLFPELRDEDLDKEIPYG